MEGLARSHRSDSAPLSRVHERERTYIPVNQGLGAPLSPAEAKRRAGEALAAQRRLAPDVEGSKDPEESKPRRAAPPLSTSDVRSRRTFEELKECDLEELQRRTRKESKEFPQAAVVKVDAAQASKPQLISVLLEHKLTGGKAKAGEVQQGAVSALQVNICSQYVPGLTHELCVLAGHDGEVTCAATGEIHDCRQECDRDAERTRCQNGCTPRRFWPQRPGPGATRAGPGRASGDTGQAG
jgi:hypothetical protein